MKYIIQTLLLFLLIGFTAGCVSDAEFLSREYPYLTTEEAIDIDSTGVTLKGKFQNFGQEEITDYGFILTGDDREINYSLMKDKPGKEFSLRVSTELEKGAFYACRAYVKTSKTQLFANRVLFESNGCMAPQIADIYPKSGYDGTRIKITGKNFSQFNDKSQVLVNTTKADIISSSPDSIVFNLPVTSLVGDATIKVKIGNNANTATTSFKILGPEITSVSTMSEHSGNIISIEGKEFLKSGNSCDVYFGNRKGRIMNSSDTKMEVVVPPFSNDLLTDLSIPVSVTIGNKRLKLNSNFTIKKSWSQKKNSFVFNNGYEHEGFTYNNEGYILEYSDKLLYKYNPDTDLWSKVSSAAYPGTWDEKSLFIPSGKKVYKLGGQPNGERSSNWLWCYDFDTNKWTQKGNMPFSFYNATYFTNNNQIYVLTSSKQLWKCDFENEQYVRLKDHPGDINFFFIFAFQSNGQTYTVTYGRTWQYDYAQDSWTQKAALPFNYYDSGDKVITFAYKDTGYVFGNSLLKYDSVNDKWLEASYCPITAIAAQKTTFVIGNKAYLLATVSDGNKLYEYSEE